MGTHLTMVIIFLLLGFTLSFIQSQFTAFHPVQVDFVHAKDGSFPQKVKIASPVLGNPINPINPRLAFGNQEPPKFSVPTGLPLSFLQKVKIASPVRGNPINPINPRLAFGNQEPPKVSVPTGLPLSTGNIVEQSKAASENVKSLFI